MLDDYDADSNRQNGSGGMDVDGDMNRRRKKPTGKQRRANQLRRANPQRETNPLQLADYQVKQAEEIMDSGKYISRGQRKRLAKKSKFVN